MNNQEAIEILKRLQTPQSWEPHLNSVAYDAIDMAISALQAQADGDCISRQAAIDEWKNDFKGYVNALNIPRDDYNGIMEYIDELPSAQPEIKPISYQDCANAMMMMWMDNVLTDGEYNRIMDKLNAHWGKKDG